MNCADDSPSCFIFSTRLSGWTFGPSGLIKPTSRTRREELIGPWGNPLPRRESSPNIRWRISSFTSLSCARGFRRWEMASSAMKRVETPFFVRNPYLFSDMAWGWMYVLHGLAGGSLRGAGYGSHLFRNPARVAVYHEVHDLRAGSLASNIVDKLRSRRAGQSMNRPAKRHNLNQRKFRPSR